MKVSDSLNPEVSHSQDLGPTRCFEDRIIKDYTCLKEIRQACAVLRKTVGLVYGSYDLLHEGHARYLRRARELCDVLIVAIDSDKAIKIRKGPYRPLVDQENRAEILAHLRHVDYVTVISDIDKDGIGGYKLLQAMMPDVFIITERNVYTTEQQTIIDRCAKKIVRLPAQSASSTTSTIRTMLIEFGDGVSTEMAEQVLSVAAQMEDQANEIKQQAEEAYQQTLTHAQSVRDETLTQARQISDLASEIRRGAETLNAVIKEKIEKI